MLTDKQKAACNYVRNELLVERLSSVEEFIRDMFSWEINDINFWEEFKKNIEKENKYKYDMFGLTKIWVLSAIMSILRELKGEKIYYES